MRILVIGGTQFVGRAFVEALRDRDDVELCLFNRGTSHPELFPKIERIKGNRETDEIERLEAREWDVVVDCCGYYPKSLARLSAILRPRVRRYIFISTLSVYDFGADTNTPITEDDDIYSCDEQQMTDTTLHTYGARKAECERVLLREWGNDAIILRPSIIYGKYDPTDRFYYWLYRVKKGREMLLPESANDIVSFTYIDDLVNVMIRSLDVAHHQSIYNVATHFPLSFAEFLAKMAHTLGTSTQTILIGQERINAEQLQMGVDFPLCFGIPLHISQSRLQTDLLPHSVSLEESFMRSAAWYESLSWPVPRTGLSVEREYEIIKVLSNT